MNLKEFLNEYKEFEDIFDIVSEPSYSFKKLEELENKYAPTVLSYEIFWYYQTQGFSELREYFPEIAEWASYYERYLRYGGDPRQLRYFDEHNNGQALYKSKMSGSKEPLILLFIGINF